MYRVLAGIGRMAALGIILTSLALIPLAGVAAAQQSTGGMPAMTGGTMPGQDQMPGMAQQGASI
jgi:hypothetical protein